MATHIQAIALPLDDEEHTLTITPTFPQLANRPLLCCVGPFRDMGTFVLNDEITAVVE